MQNAMVRKLDAVPLTRQTASQVFPLAQSLVPHLDLEGWLAFAHRAIAAAGSGGIIGLRDDLGYFHGFFGYFVRHDGLGGPVLAIEHAAAMDLLDRAGSAAVLAQEIESVAAQLGCADVHVHLRPAQRRLRRLLEAEGHTLRGIVLEKAVAAD